MDSRVYSHLLLLLLLLLVHASLSSGLVQSSITNSKRDITTPLPTVPTVTPATPILNPTSNPDGQSTTTMNPTTTVPTTSSSSSSTSSSSGGASWCVASTSASQAAIQVALDWACGYGGADCSSIVSGGSCFIPNTLHHHASFAFNSYYQKHPVPSSCNFGGTALISSTDPSTVTCQYPSTSTSSSILNTTNSNGSTVFGSVPTTPSTSSAAETVTSPSLFIVKCLMITLLELVFMIQV